jgi:DNA gyrase subunit A
MVRRSSSKKKIAHSAEHADFVEGAKSIVKSPFSDFLLDTYIRYAIAVIKDRALTNSNDGFKPVHKRILWSMYENGVLPSRHPSKSITVVGAVLGAYHPHGDASVYDAMATLAQDFTTRVPLIDGKGNWGYHPGDEPAASRYTECRLAPPALEALRDIKDGAAEMGKNFDGKHDEPKFLPVRFPNLIINGTNGIAVGYASHMPSHNPVEAIRACQYVLNHKDATIDDVLRIMPGPDWCTGGTIIGTDGIRDYYRTGRGSVIVRAKYKIEYATAGRATIVFYQLPPNVSVASVVEKVRGLVKNSKTGIWNKISSIDNYTGRDQGGDVKLVLRTKTGANVRAVIAALFSKTPLQTTFSVNNTTLVDNKPTVLNELELIKDFLQFRRGCVLRKAGHAMTIKVARVHAIDGLLSVIVDIDAAISIIRHSESVETARTKLMKRFSIDADQADYVLSMQLRRLTKQDSLALRNERKGIESDIRDLNKVIKSRSALDKYIDDELDGEAEILKDPRHTEILDKDAAQAMKDDRKAIRAVDHNDRKYVYETADGRILLTANAPAVKPEPGSRITPHHDVIRTEDNGVMVMLMANGDGEPTPTSYLREDTAMKYSDVHRTGTGVALLPLKTDMIVATRGGKIRRYGIELSPNAAGRQLVNVKDDDVIAAVDVSGVAAKSTVVLITARGRVLRFPLDSLRTAGAGSAPIVGMKLAKGDEVASLLVARPGAGVLLSASERTLKATALSDIPTQSRAGAGVICHTVAAADRIVDAVIDGVATKGGKVIVPPPATVRGRRPMPAMGVRLSI